MNGKNIKKAKNNLTNYQQKIRTLSSIFYFEFKPSI